MKRHGLWMYAWAYLLAVALTAFCFESVHTVRRYLDTRSQLILPTFCELWGGTFVGYFCDTGSGAGGGESGAR